MTEDERALVEFMVWHVRTGDVPARIRGAVIRVARTGRYPRPRCRANDYFEGPHRVTVFPPDDDAPLALRPLDVGRTVEDHLPVAQYILVDPYAY